MIGDDVLLEMGQEYLGLVRNRNFRDNCVFGFSLDSGEVVPSSSGYCHGAVGWPDDVFNIKKFKPVAINTRIQKESRGYSSEFGRTHGGLLPNDYFEEYYDFLFNRSVFADCYVTKTTEGLRNGGVVVVRCDNVPANLMAAACVAVRRGWEYTSMSKSLINMMRMGIEPNLAHLVSYQLTVTKTGDYHNQVYAGHQSVYSSYFDKSGVQNFREGKLPPSSSHNTEPYINTCRYKGLYGMWNTHGEKAHYKPLRLGYPSNIVPDSDPFGVIKTLTPFRRQNLTNVIKKGLSEL